MRTNILQKIANEEFKRKRESLTYCKKCKTKTVSISGHCYFCDMEKDVA